MNVFGLPTSPLVDIQIFNGNSVTTTGPWAVWRKPQGRAMCSILAIGGGGAGGTGAIGANSAAGGGGGGGGGAQTYSIIPLAALPELLYIAAGRAVPSGSGNDSYVSIQPNATVNHLISRATAGTGAGNASGGTGGSAGLAGSANTASQMPLGWIYAVLTIQGQDGNSGGNAAAGLGISLPTTGSRTTGGTGGGGLPAAAATGTNGGAFTVPSAPSAFPPHASGVGSATATAPADSGSNGYQVSPAGLYFYGGTGGASTHGSATGSGLQQSSGGDGGIGCGGGGGGGALTGSAAGVAGKGGPGLVIITCW